MEEVSISPAQGSPLQLGSRISLLKVDGSSTQPECLLEIYKAPHPMAELESAF